MHACALLVVLIQTLFLFLFNMYHSGFTTISCLCTCTVETWILENPKSKTSNSIQLLRVRASTGLPTVHIQLLRVRASTGLPTVHIQL